MEGSDLESAPEQFDATDANVRRLEQAWAEMQTLIPEGITFVGGSPEDRRYRELLWGASAHRCAHRRHERALHD